MLQRRVRPNVITFSAMITCAAFCSMHHKAVELFKMMGSFECEPHDNMSASIIGSYACVGDVDTALRLYDLAKKEKWKVDKGVFSALINMYGKLGSYDGCESLYDDMKVLGVKENLATYTNMLYAIWEKLNELIML
jgi:pentatricopeptide repeat protein